MPPSQPEPSNRSNRSAYKSAEASAPLIAKAARKLQYPTESESSDHRSTIASSNQYDGESSYADFSDTDTDIFQRPLNRDARRDPARPPLVAKRAKHAARRVNFDLPNDSDSDNATVRAESSPRRVQQNSPTQPAVPRAPPNANRIKQSGNNKAVFHGSLHFDNPRELAPAQKARRSAPNLDTTRDKVVKSTRVHDFRKVKIRQWGPKFTRKENKQGGRRYARMSIGSAGQRGPSQNPGLTPSQDRRRRWFLRNGNIGSRRNRTYDPENENESESYEEDVHQPPQRAPTTVRDSQSAMKSTRLPVVPSHESDIEGQSDSGNSFQDDNDFLGGPAEPDMSGKDEDEALEHTVPSQALLDGLERLILSVVRLDKMQRLPFLRRNLRRGFQLHCRMVGIDTEPHPLPRTSISVVYSCPLIHDASSEQGGIRDITAKSSMKDWLCPLCDLHKKFYNPRMLDKHLAWDHSGVKVLWDDHHTELSLTIPGSHPEFNPVITRPVPIREPSISSNSRHDERSNSTDSDLKSLVRTSSTPSGVASESGFSTASTVPTSVEMEDVKPKYDASGYSNQAVAGTQTRSSSASGRSVSQALSSADTQDGLGPSAVPPYLSETPDERGDVYYSCRPGGPRLFDIMNPQSLKRFGVLKWVIIDREEELFELDDILDEDKVMLVLWHRWIFLNRNKFVASYFDGTKAFIKENWELIKQGAGLLALRAWLLILLVNNFLLPMEVATLMRFYQEMANIRLQ